MTKLRATAWMTGILLLAWLVRWTIVVGPLSVIESDEAVAGLMALRILAGDRPVFFWGQPYLGALEMYLSAPLFWAAGATPFTLKFVPIALSLLFITTLYSLGVRVYTRRVGVVCAGCAACSTFLVIHGVKAYGYTPVFLLGNLLLWTATGFAPSGRSAAPRARTWGRPFAIGLLMGLLFWAHPVGLIYICAVGVWLLQVGVSRLRQASAPAEWMRGWMRHAGVMGIGASIGLLPVLVWNVRHDWATLRFLLGAESGSWGELLARLERMRAVFPILLGTLQSSSNADLFWTHAGQRYPLYMGGIFVGLVLVGWTVVLLAAAIWRYARTGEVWTDWLFLYTAVIASVVFVASRYGDFANEPRYLWPVFSATPLWIGRLRILATRRPLRRLHLVSVSATIFIIVNLYTLLNLIPALNQPWVDGVPYPADMQPLLTDLARDEIDAIYADYWICNRLLFESRTQILCAVIGGVKPDGVKRGWNRSVAYAAAVARASSPAWVFVADTAPERAFATLLREREVAYTRHVVDGYAVYDHLSRRLVPLE